MLRVNYSPIISKKDADKKINLPSLKIPPEKIDPFDIIEWIKQVATDPTFGLDPTVASMLQHILETEPAMLHTIATQIHDLTDEGILHIHHIPELIWAVNEVMNCHSEMLSRGPFTVVNIIESIRLLFNLLIESSLLYVPEKKLCLQVLNTSIRLLETSLDIKKEVLGTNKDPCCFDLFSLFFSKKK
jgi:hypothetical protein